MRRSKQEITDKKEITNLISEAETARLAINRDGAPYIVPLNFGFEDDTFFFHCAGEGLKLSLLKADPRVCIEIDKSSPLQKNGNENPCDWGVNYRSVIAVGEAVFIEDFEEKKTALNVILSKFVDGKLPPTPDSGINAVTLFKVKPSSLTAKQSD